MRGVVGRKAKFEHGHVSRDNLVAPLTPGASTNKSGRVARVKLVEQRSKTLQLALVPDQVARRTQGESSTVNSHVLLPLSAYRDSSRHTPHKMAAGDAIPEQNSGKYEVLSTIGMHGVRSL